MNLNYFFMAIIFGAGTIQIAQCFEFVFGPSQNHDQVHWDGMDSTVPPVIEPDIKAANLSVLLRWLELADRLKQNFELMKERANQCDGTCDIPNYGDEQEAHMPPFPISSADMIPKIDEALRRMTIYENRLLEELRKPEKDWNYSVESSTPPV